MSKISINIAMDNLLEQPLPSSLLFLNQDIVISRVQTEGRHQLFHAVLDVPFGSNDMLALLRHMSGRPDFTEDGVMDDWYVVEQAEKGDAFAKRLVSIHENDPVIGRSWALFLEHHRKRFMAVLARDRIEQDDGMKFFPVPPDERDAVEKKVRAQWAEGCAFEGSKAKMRQLLPSFAQRWDGQVFQHIHSWRQQRFASLRGQKKTKKRAMRDTIPSHPNFAVWPEDAIESFSKYLWKTEPIFRQFLLTAHDVDLLQTEKIDIPAMVKHLLAQKYGTTIDVQDGVTGQPLTISLSKKVDAYPSATISRALYAGTHEFSLGDMPISLSFNSRGKEQAQLHVGLSSSIPMKPSFVWKVDEAGQRKWQYEERGADGNSLLGAMVVSAIAGTKTPPKMTLKDGVRDQAALVAAQPLLAHMTERFWIRSPFLDALEEEARKR